MKLSSSTRIAGHYNMRENDFWDFEMLGNGYGARVATSARRARTKLLKGRSFLHSED